MNGSTGVISGTVAAGSAGTSTVTLNISDGMENVSVLFTWTVTNPGPSGQQYVRFVADSEINGNPWTSMAELNVLDTNGNPLNQASWSVVSFDSAETVGEDERAVNAIDGNPATIWHTEWASTTGDDNDLAHPHEIVVDLGASYDLGGYSEGVFIPNTCGQSKFPSTHLLTL